MNYLKLRALSRRNIRKPKDEPNVFTGRKHHKGYTYASFYGGAHLIGRSQAIIASALSTFQPSHCILDINLFWSMNPSKIPCRWD